VYTGHWLTHRRRCNDLCTPGTDWLICQSEGASSDTSRANQSQYSLYVLFEMTFAKPDQERTTLLGYLCIDRSFFFFLFLFFVFWSGLLDCSLNKLRVSLDSFMVVLNGVVYCSLIYWRSSSRINDAACRLNCYAKQFAGRSSLQTKRQRAFQRACFKLMLFATMARFNSKQNCFNPFSANSSGTQQLLAPAVFLTLAPNV